MKSYFNKLWIENKKLRKTVGGILILVGFLSIITPLTPLGFLLIIGLEMVGLRALFWNKLKSWVDRVAKS